MLEEGIASESTGEINETTCGPLEAEARVCMAPMILTTNI